MRYERYEEEAGEVRRVLVERERRAQDAASRLVKGSSVGLVLRIKIFLTEDFLSLLFLYNS